MTKAFENAIKAVKENDWTPSTIPPSYDLGAEDMTALGQMAMDGQIFKALCMAFDFGFVMGNRATISRNLKRL